MKGKVLKILKYMGFGFIGLIIIGIVFGKPMADEIIINEENITMDIHQSQQVALTVHPDDGLLSEDDFECSDTEIIKIEEIKDGKLILKSLEKEGLVTLQYKKDDVKSNSVTIQVVNQQALAMAKAKEKEEAEKKQAEIKQQENAKKAEDQKKAEEQKKADEKKKSEQAKKNTAQTASQHSSSQSNKSSSTSSSNQSHHTNSAMVYIPKTGKKYHSNANCSNMKNPSQVSLSEAQSRGFTACKKCY